MERSRHIKPGYKTDKYSTPLLIKKSVLVTEYGQFNGLHLDNVYLSENLHIHNLN